MRRLLILLAASSALTACSMETPYVRPALPVQAALPTGGPYAAQPSAAPVIRYADVFTDARLRSLVDQALANNRDLRVAAADILAARAQYRIQRADRFPRLDVSGRYARTGGSSANEASKGDAYSVNLGVTAFELDLFGRVRSLSDAALQRYFATEAAERATHLTLVGDVAEAWLTYAADSSLLRIAEQTVANAQRSVELTDARLKGGVAPRTDLRQAQTILASAQADIARQRTAVAQDLNALQLLVGAQIDPALLSTSIEDAAPTLAPVAAGLGSDVLLRRPDVVQAEHQLRAMNAEVGAARAALFPTISLTGATGYASKALTSLFTSGASSWSAGAGLAYPIFQAGAGRAGLGYAKAERDAAVATYEKAIQSAFRETADALARQGTIDDERAADRLQLEAASDSYTLTDARYRTGNESFLTSLDAQRTLYDAQRTFVAIQLEGAVSRVDLYRALGGETRD
jgi:multidrug efflux system outer membrane protein